MRFNNYLVTTGGNVRIDLAEGYQLRVMQDIRMQLSSNYVGNYAMPSITMHGKVQLYPPL